MRKQSKPWALAGQVLCALSGRHGVAIADPPYGTTDHPAQGGNLTGTEGRTWRLSMDPICHLELTSPISLCKSVSVLNKLDIIEHHDTGKQKINSAVKFDQVTRGHHAYQQ